MQVNVRLSPEADDLIEQVRRSTKLTKEQIVESAVLHAYQAQVRGA